MLFSKDLPLCDFTLDIGIAGRFIDALYLLHCNLRILFFIDEHAVEKPHILRDNIKITESIAGISNCIVDAGGILQELRNFLIILKHFKNYAVELSNFRLRGIDPVLRQCAGNPHKVIGKGQAVNGSHLITGVFAVFTLFTLLRLFLLQLDRLRLV